MIEVMLRDLRGRLALVLLLCVMLYFLEPGFHEHGPVDPELASEMGPLVTREHRDRVASFLDSGVAHGATLRADGRQHVLVAVGDRLYAFQLY